MSQLPGKETLTIQLLNEDDRSVDDAETTQERWAQYIESFALVCFNSFFLCITPGNLKPLFSFFRPTQRKVSSSASTRPSSDETLQRSILAKKNYLLLPVRLLPRTMWKQRTGWKSRLRWATIECSLPREQRIISTERTSIIKCRLNPDLKSLWRVSLLLNLNLLLLLLLILNLFLPLLLLLLLLLLIRNPLLPLLLIRNLLLRLLLLRLLLLRRKCRKMMRAQMWMGARKRVPSQARSCQNLPLLQPSRHGERKREMCLGSLY